MPKSKCKTVEMLSFRKSHIIKPEYICVSGAVSRSLKKAEINLLMPSDAYMRRQPETSLVQIMACRMFGAKPLSEPKLEYCQLNEILI